MEAAAREAEVTDNRGLGRREENHTRAQQNPEFFKNMARFAQGQSKSGAKPRGHLKSDSRRGGGTHER
jgi:hypothetical protein